MSDKYYIDASSFLEVTSELADYIMQENMDDEYENYIYEDEDEVLKYTEEGQKIFNYYVEVIEGYLGAVGIVHEDQDENK